MNMGEPCKDPTLYKTVDWQIKLFDQYKTIFDFFCPTSELIYVSTLCTTYEATLTVLKYLNSNPNEGILLSSESSFQLNAYCD